MLRVLQETLACCGERNVKTPATRVDSRYLAVYHTDMADEPRKRYFIDLGDAKLLASLTLRAAQNERTVSAEARFAIRKYLEVGK